MAIAAGQQKQVSPFPTVPQVQANIGSLFACVQALQQCMNILIVNAQQGTQSPNLSGTNIFALSSDLQALQKRVTAIEKQI